MGVVRREVMQVVVVRGAELRVEQVVPRARTAAALARVCDLCVREVCGGVVRRHGQCVVRVVSVVRRPARRGCTCIRSPSASRTPSYRLLVVPAGMVLVVRRVVLQRVVAVLGTRVVRYQLQGATACLRREEQRWRRWRCDLRR